MAHMDLNSDIGESFGSWRMGDDATMLTTITSANIACGFHGGDPLTIRTTAQTAVNNGVAIGAHIGYRDLAGFGRRYIDYAPAELAADVLYQLSALDGITRTAGGAVTYVKPHGALNTTPNNQSQIQAVIDTIAEYNSELVILAMPGSYWGDYARQEGLRVVSEAFADRNYNPDGTLVSRRDPEAIIHDSEQVVENMLRLAEEGVIIARDGSRVELEAASICTHGDTAGAVAIAQQVRSALEDAGVEITAFTS